MFSIYKKMEDGFNKVILKDELTGTIAAIVPECSSMLHSFSILKNEESFNVILSYDSLDDFKKNVTQKGYRGVKLSPYVCRIHEAKYRFGEKEYFLEKSLPAKHALHGLIYDRPFEIIGEDANENAANVTMKYIYNNEDPGYPFIYECIVNWRLEKENRLTVKTTCINKSDGLIPMQDGWHPYFCFGNSINDLQMEFQSMEKVMFNEELVPTGKLTEYDHFNSLTKFGDTFLDNCFTLNFDTCQPMCVLRSPAHQVQVEFYPEKSYPYLQIYTPDDRKSIAIENLSGTPDAFNNGMGVQTLESGQSCDYTVTYQLRLLKK